MTEKDELRTLSPEVRAARLTAQRALLQFIPAWLKYRGLRKKHIANILEVSQSVVSRYFSGEAMMPAGALEQIAILLQADRGAILHPPPSGVLGPMMDATIQEMERLGPEQWQKVLEVARAMREPTKT
jgi:predicted XRE-type DNA-binding protein